MNDAAADVIKAQGRAHREESRPTWNITSGMKVAQHAKEEVPYSKETLTKAWRAAAV